MVRISQARFDPNFECRNRIKRQFEPSGNPCHFVGLLELKNNSRRKTVRGGCPAMKLKVIEKSIFKRAHSHDVTWAELTEISLVIHLKMPKHRDNRNLFKRYINTSYSSFVFPSLQSKYLECIL